MMRVDVDGKIGQTSGRSIVAQLRLRQLLRPSQVLRGGSVSHDAGMAQLFGASWT